MNKSDSRIYQKVEVIGTITIETIESIRKSAQM